MKIHYKTSLDEKKIRKIISEELEKQLSNLQWNQSNTWDADLKLTREQLKARYHISLPTILRLEKKGVLKGYRLGRRVLFDIKEVEKSLKERRFKSESK